MCNGNDAKNSTRKQFVVVQGQIFVLKIDFFTLGNPTKHMHIQDTFQTDGISYESGDELSDIDVDLTKEDIVEMYLPSASPASPSPTSTSDSKRPNPIL